MKASSSLWRGEPRARHWTAKSKTVSFTAGGKDVIFCDERISRTRLAMVCRTSPPIHIMDTDSTVAVAVLVPVLLFGFLLIMSCCFRQLKADFSHNVAIV